jgi:mRNA-degrading endonuclease RelE of RelBE toxin-antitoxin system
MVIIMTMMASRRPYTLIYPPAVSDHLKSIDVKYHGLIQEKVEEQLLGEPGVETRNQKPLRQPAACSARWEIRFGPGNRFRVLYDIDEVAHEVYILAIGQKERDRLLVGGEDVEI